MWVFQSCFIQPQESVNELINMVLGDQKYVVTRKMDSIVPMNKEEAIFLAKFPDGSKPEGYQRAPIERDDWPAPPEPAAAYPELCMLTSLFSFSSICEPRYQSGQ